MGQHDGVTDDHGQFIAKVKFNAIYNITASKDGYQSASVQETGRSGKFHNFVTSPLKKTWTGDS